MPSRPDAQVTLADAQVEVCQREFAPAFEQSSARAMYALRATARLANEKAAEWLAAYGLNGRSVNVLMALFCAPENVLPINDIGREIHTAGARLTVTIDTMERDGLLTRRIAPNDRRRVMVRLTAKGKRSISAAFPVLAANFQRALRGLSLEEREQLLHLLLRVNAGLEDTAPDVDRR